MGTPPPPPVTPSFPAIVRAYERLVSRIARHAGVPAGDVPDIAQEAFLRLHAAIRAGRVDASRSLGGWLIKTTRSLARDHLKRASSRYEALVAPDAAERLVGTPDRQDRMNEAIDVHTIIDRILDKLRREDREVFVMSDLEDTPMDEIMEELNLKRTTAYARLAAGRAAFAREWEAMQRSGDPALAPFVALGVAELIAAEHVLPEVPPGFTEDLLRRLTEQLGPEAMGPASVGPASSAPGAVAGAGLGAAAGAAVAGTVTLAAWQLGLLCLVMVLVGAGVHAGLRPAAPAVTPAVPVAFHDPGPAAPVGAPPDEKPAVSETAPQAASSAAPVVETQAKLVESARQFLRTDQPAKALAVLARVTDPELATVREALRQEALAEQVAAARP